jgi:hypothetical protein
MVHICEYEITQGGCKRKKSCKFNHSLETDHNINVLGLRDYQNIDFYLLKEVIQVSY